ncbi:hypothetical protein [Azospirillum isscasi]|uniref:Uncharacterized protein n=1 Tax=Azospirillum isscasi TaxID=3053926 RepID=A0ABU0WR37_9PROT|nr:hypothetical protein [Azospirillum isscasi]MDQ2106715.1 hypothetical protein [Azospirillum isscasi]
MFQTNSTSAMAPPPPPPLLGTMLIELPMAMATRTANIAVLTAKRPMTSRRPITLPPARPSSAAMVAMVAMERARSLALTSATRALPSSSSQNSGTPTSSDLLNGTVIADFEIGTDRLAFSDSTIDLGAVIASATVVKGGTVFTIGSGSSFTVAGRTGDVSGWF